MSAAGQEKPSRGDRMRLKADFVGVTVDMAKAYQAGKLPQGMLDVPDLNRTPLQIRNATGGTLPRFGVVGFGEVKVDPASDEFKNQLVIEGVEPQANKLDRFAIVQEGGIEGAVIECVCVGETHAKIDVSDESHEYAQAIEGDTTKLASCGYGPAEIVWREGGTGEQMAIVRLTPAARQTRWVKCSTTPDVTSYPTAGNVMPVEFGEYALASDPVSLLGSYTSPTWSSYSSPLYGVAVDTQKRFWKSGAVARVSWLDGNWTFERANGILRAKAAADIAAGYSGNVTVKINGATAYTVTAYNDWDAADVANNDELRITYNEDTGRWDILKRGGSGSTSPVNGCIRINLSGGSGYIYADGSSSSMSTPYTIDQYGIWLFPSSMEGVYTNSLGTIFTRPTPTSYADNAIEVGQKNHYMVTLHTTWKLPPETLTSARNRFRAAGHKHDYVVSGTTYNTTTETPDVRGLDDGVNVQIASYIADYLGTTQLAGTSSTNLWYGSDDYRYCHHSGVADIICTSTLRHIRFQVKRLDSNSYGAPELHSAYALIQQVGEPTL